MQNKKTATAKEYRTREQFIDIVEEAGNGNFKDAGRKCAEYGFWANDIKTALETYEVYDVDYTDFILLVEIAMEYRAQNN